MKEVEQYVYENKLLLNQRQEWEDDWKDVRDYIMPKHGQFIEDKPNEGRNRYGEILDGTGGHAMRILAAGMQGGLTSPARPWFRLSLRDKNLMQSHAIRTYMHDIEKRMYAVFAKSNFYTAIHTLYAEQAGFGQAVILQLEDMIDLIRFYPLTVGEYSLSSSYRRDVNGVWRLLYMTAQQIKEKWPNGSFPKAVRDDLEGNEKNPFKFHQVLHIIRPRNFYNPKKIDQINMPWESIYVDYEEQETIIHKGGFREKPFAAPRWIVTGSDVYGRGPGLDILADVKQLQEMTYDKLIAIAKMIKPPMKAPAALKYKVEHAPGDITYGERSDLEKLEPLYNIAPNVAQFNTDIQDLRNQIKAGCYNDLFLMMSAISMQKTPITATEVVERHEEKLLQLGPVIERQFNELLNPIIERTFGIMLRNGLIPPPPAELVNAAQGSKVEMEVEYISLLAQAQKMVSIGSINAVANFATGLSQFNPEVLDKFDMDEAVDQYGEAIGAPPKIIRSDDDVERIREARRAEQKRLQELEEAAGMTQAVKNLGQAKVEEGTALNEIKKNVGGE